MKTILILLAMVLPMVANAQLVGDGKTDNQLALQKALDEAATTRQPLILSAGEFLHSGMLTVSGTSLQGQGSKTILRGTTTSSNSIVLTGAGPSISNLRLTYNAQSRVTTDTSSLILIKQATNFAVSNMDLQGSDSTAIFVNNSVSGTIVSNTIRDTLADSIHITNKSSRILVERNSIDKSGDDGIAVVSYEKNNLPSTNITIRNNRVTDNVHARGISVVGGQDVLIERNYVRCAQDYAGIYIASESSYKTLGVKNVTVNGNTVESCGSKIRGHDSIMAYTDYKPNSGITITGNTVKNSRRAKGIWTFTVNNVAQTGVKVENNTVTSSRHWWQF